MVRVHGRPAPREVSATWGYDSVARLNSRAAPSIRPPEAQNFQISSGRSASQTPDQILKFERADWTSFRTVEGLQQKAFQPDSRSRCRSPMHPHHRGAIYPFDKDEKSK
jgi:hypothetical protein